MNSCTTFISLLLLFLSADVMAWNNPKTLTTKKLNQIGNNSYSPLNISWIGQGGIGKFTISNFGENGYFEPPVNWSGYTGEYPNGLRYGYGDLSEFPKGSNQYYTWDAGAWFGAG